MRRLLVLLMLALTVAAAATEGAKYVIIAPDGFQALAQALADWKTLKGVPAMVVPTSEVGFEPESLRAFLRNAYELWPVRPEYVLLLGSPRLIRSYGDRNDCWFGSMSGDHLMEIPVGRLPADNPDQCATLVSKVLTYENPPPEADMSWCAAGATVVREDVPPDPYYQADSRLAHTYWRNAGFGTVDSFADFRGHTSADINRAAQEGRAFITYRGRATGRWYAPFESVYPGGWQNGHRLPVVVAATCATVTLAPYESMYGDQFVCAGTLGALSGAVAYFGTTRSGDAISQYRSACYRGFFDALYQEGEYRLGPATLRARFRVDSIYHDVSRYAEWNLLGDPELNVWTAGPRPLEVSHDEQIEPGLQRYEVLVTSAGTPVGPVEGSLVCLSMDSTVYETGRTDNEGRVVLNIAPANLGEMNVVVSGRNLRPYTGKCVVAPNSGVCERPGIKVQDVLASVVRGVLFLEARTQPGAVLLDVSGRQVMKLGPGANDLDRLVPGVYHMVEQDRPRSRRVIVTR